MKKEFSFSGIVVKGENVGKKLGFPTANIERRGFSRLAKKPELGVYAGIIILPNGSKKKASFVIGPKDEKGLPKLEGYIFNFSRNLYGKKVRFILKEFLRPFKKYKNQKDLVEQIKKDIKTSEKILG